MYDRHALADRLAEFTQPTGIEARLDVRDPPRRWEISRAHAWAVAGVVVCVLVAFFVFRAAAGGSGSDGVLGAEGNGAPGGRDYLAEVAPHQDAKRGDAEAGSVKGGEVVVSVVGAVEKPGLVTLPAASRAAQAVQAARPKPEADVFALNGAQRLTDGVQIYVPARGEAPRTPPPPGAGTGGSGAGAAAGAAGAGAGAAGGGVSLNSATAEQLTALSGVGEKTAAAIIAHREQIGGFQTVEQLQDVKGIGPAKFAALKDQVTL